jgi:BirA family biotin operon repressor/biotin-[acetyl-CoA-carboxylase] ligase
MTRHFRDELAAMAGRHGIRIDYRDEATSTNDAIAAEGYRSGDLVVAEVQTAGRGQRGNRWSSPGGENLTFSQLFLPADLPAESQFYLSRALSLTLADTLEDFGVTAEIKWPNDICVGGRKIAGLLIENDLMGASIRRSILGVGLNVNQTRFDPALPNPTSMALEAGRPFARAGVLDRYLSRAAEWFARLEAGGREAIDRRYREGLYRRTGEHPFAEPGGEPFLASIEAVEPSGELVLRRADGRSKAYLFKEIEFL